jgi:hypothetical protein
VQAQDVAAFEAWKSSEVARLERDRRVLDKQGKALLKVGGWVLGVRGMTTLHYYITFVQRAGMCSQSCKLTSAVLIGST